MGSNPECVLFWHFADTGQDHVFLKNQYQMIFTWPGIGQDQQLFKGMRPWRPICAILVDVSYLILQVMTGLLPLFSTAAQHREVENVPGVAYKYKNHHDENENTMDIVLVQCFFNVKEFDSIKELCKASIAITNHTFDKVFTQVIPKGGNITPTTWLENTNCITV